MAGKVVVVAIDDSPQAEQAFREVASAYEKDSTVFYLVHVRPDHREYEIDKLYAFKSHWEHLEKARKEVADSIMAHYKELAEQLQVRHELVLKEATLLSRDAKKCIGKVLCDYAAEVKADELVLAPHGKGILKFLTGSVARYCTHHAPCPLLLTGPIPLQDTEDRREDQAAAAEEQPVAEPAAAATA